MTFMNINIANKYVLVNVYCQIHINLNIVSETIVIDHTVAEGS